MTRLLLAEIWRLTQLSVGWVLLIFGPLIGGPFPGPFGIIGFAAGLILVLRNSRWARRYFIRLKRRYPGKLGPIRHALKHGINLTAVLQRVWDRIRAPFARRTPPKGGGTARKPTGTASRETAPLEGSDG